MAQSCVGGFLLALVALPCAFASGADRRYPLSACSLLVKAYPDKVSLSGSDSYKNQTEANWSQTCVLPPNCVFEPTTAKEVAAAVIILRSTNTKFAVRSGGHMPVPGAASIGDGVLLSLNRLNSKKLVNGKTAQIGPGLRWIEVYDWLASKGLSTAGGRFGPVGVGGLLLGGGINYYGSHAGWSANSVLNYEVVLGDGRIVNANANSNSDLWWALKGGSNNFGIVTRYDLSTFPISDVWGGTLVYDGSQLNDYVHAVANFVPPQGGSADVFAAADPLMLIFPSTGQIQPAAILFHKQPQPSPAAFENFTSVQPIFGTAGVRAFTNFMAEQNTASYSDPTQRRAFYDTSLKALPESVYLANNTFIDAALAELSDIPNLLTSITYQTISKDWLVAAKAAGGDAIDLDPQNGGFISVLISTTWQDPALDQRVADFSNRVLALIDEKAAAVGLAYPFKNINDAGHGEAIYKYYGGGKSLPKMRAIRRKYDPAGIFQKLVPGGFKLGL